MSRGPRILPGERKLIIELLKAHPVDEVRRLTGRTYVTLFRIAQANL